MFISSRRLLYFDELFQLLVDDIDTNILYLNKLTSTSTFENSPEILDAQKNMKVMSVRLDEYVVRMEELSNRQLRKRVERKIYNPPVVR